MDRPVAGELSAETLRFVEAHRCDDVRAIALGSLPAGVDRKAALLQIAGYQTALHKLPTWSRTEGILYPGRLPLEQCSSEQTARYKARLVTGDTLADLTGGFGIDCYFLSARFRTSAYVERQEELCRIARHNFALLRRPDIAVIHADGLEYLRRMEPVDCLYLDPARRDLHGGKVVAVADCEPDVSAWETLLLRKASTVLVKLSPMLDISQALRQLHSVRAVHVVSVRNECKELLLLLSATEAAEGEALSLHCVDLREGEGSGDLSEFVFSPAEEARAECTYADRPEACLYEPNASVMKAGGYRSLAARYGLKALHPNSHLYTSSRLVPDFPGRRFRVEQVCGFGKRALKEVAAIGRANLAVRNFPASAEELRRRLKLSDGGDTYLFATTLAGGDRVLLRCRKA